MNKNKINDFVNIWTEAIGLTGEKNKKYINFIKTDIARRCEMYEKEIPTISIKDDSCTAYIIKPVNGQYSFEDFLLNRLMLGLREVDFTGALEGNGGEYVAYDKSLCINVELIESLVKDKETRHVGLQGKSTKVAQKTLEHELGHCLKTVFNNGFKAPLGKGRKQDESYKKIIEVLSKYENGKYAMQIKSLKDFELELDSKEIKTGVGDSKASYGYDYRFTNIDELLNETEALELTKSNEIQEKWPLQDEKGKDSSSGNYVNVYNYLSGYRPFTGYGPIFKSLLGKENTFRAEYISSVDILKEFDKEYADVIQEVWGLDPQKYSPIKCIFVEFDEIVKDKYFDENIMLKLDEFFAKCYERKIEKIMTQNNGNVSPEFLESILNEIANFQSKLTTNDNPQKREQLIHNVIFENIKTRINEKAIQNDQNDIIGNTNLVREDLEQNNLQSEKTDNLKMKFINNFIQAYNDTETEYQYETRLKDEPFNIKRVEDIIESNGLNKMLIVDLEGRLISTLQDEEFKIQYSQKQVSAMARLLKAAQLLTDNKKLNPTGRNYLEEFSSIPDIQYKLKQMSKDLQDSDSYMFELKENAKANRINGTLPNFPKTPGEIEVSDSTTTRSTSGQGLKQEMGISTEQTKKIEQAENEARRQEEDAKRKVNEEEIAKSNEMYSKQQNKLAVESIKRGTFNSNITSSEVNELKEETKERKQKNALLFKSKVENLNTEEQQRLNMLNDKYGKPQRQSTGQRKSNGMGR